jgi:hypothetical protein
MKQYECKIKIQKFFRMKRASPSGDLCLRVPAKKALEVQELHLPVYHTLRLLIENEFFPPKGTVSPTVKKASYLFAPAGAPG